MAMDKIPAKIKPPECIELKLSTVDKKRIGSFSLVPISKGTEFGPYEGRIAYDKDDETLDPKFSWEVFDLKTFKYLHTVDATNPNHGNWMRYVCCARFFEEQNIVSTQNGSEVYYRALKDIDEGEELLTWFQPKKKKRKRSSVRNSIDADVQKTLVYSSEASYSPPHSPSKLKRKRKPKVIPDTYIGPLDWEEGEPQVKKSKDDAFEPLQPGQKRRRRKKLSTDNDDTEVMSSPPSPTAGNKLVIEEETETVKPDLIKIEDGKEDRKYNLEKEKLFKKVKKSVSGVSTVRKNSSSSEAKKEASPNMSIAEINNSVEWEFPENGKEYNFELKKNHTVTVNGKKLYKCDICLGLYKHMFSLKRHYLRNHINYKYLSKSDMTNCLINLAQVKTLMRNKFPDNEKTKSAPADTNFKSESKSNNQHENMVANETVISEHDETEKSETESAENATEAGETSLKADKQVYKDNSDIKTHTNSKDKVEDEKNESSVSEKDDSADGHNSSFVSKECLKIEENDTENEISEGTRRKSETVNRDDENLVKGNDTDQDKVEEIKETKEKCVLMPGLFRCYTCYLTFNDFESIREHTQNHPEQTDGACFPCDKCSMRFNYKHNLVRHKKTHEVGGIESKSSVPINGEKSDRPSPRKHLLPTKNLHQQEKKQLLLPSVFRCAVCPMKFDTQLDILKHVKEEHKTGSKFQCIYCGKDFLSMPNMKKHVRFHLGYRATCRICSEAFSNVGALRKHTRVSHPDIYKAKLIERLEKYGVLRGPDKNALSKEIVDKVNLSRKKSIESNETKESTESIKTEVKTEIKTSEKEEEVDNEINFTADEIDDGGSRFKFACTVCKKRFSSYINMCRHRRKIHSNENRHRTEQCLTFGRKPRNIPSPIFENPLEVAAFYANVSNNIATNLNCYIDGKPESLKTFVDHIKVENYQGNFGYNDENEQPIDLTWEKYNFPRDYQPVQTISFADIKNVLNIHNDFDSHCLSVDAISTDCNNDLKTIRKEEKNIVKHSKEETNVDSERHSTQTTNFSEKPVKDKDFEESLEDIEVREINSERCKKGVTLEENLDSSKVEELDTMGKSSHGLKVLANLGSVLLKKGGADVNEAKQQEVRGEGKGFKRISFGASICVDSPAAKTFHQVKLGEYANFQDDLLSWDIDSSVQNEAQHESRQHYRHLDGLSEEKGTADNQTASNLFRSAQDELKALYDSIDNCEPVRDIIRKSPKSLGELCEDVLGLCKRSKEQKTDSSLKIEIASQLKLSNCDLKNQSGKRKENVPDYSDAPEESPFYNYESIAFGKNGSIEKVCGVCRKHFCDMDALLRHHSKKHPAVECRFLEVEQGHEIEDLHFSDPSYVGALAVTDPGLDNLSDLESFRCTNCAAAFKSISKLHVHVVICSSIDPVYGLLKTENSPSKMPFKRKLQKKIFSLFGNKNDVKSDLNSTDFKLSQQRSETQSPKRVFTGCRKRTSCILPDSPQNRVSEQRTSIPTASGYNPQNHVRRRELTEILDTLTCEACGLKFKTIILLERHVKYCTKKEKFKSIQPMACPVIDESLEKIKNMCLYCGKNFTYTKSLLNHLQDFCPVKRAKLDKGELSEEDKLKESEILERIHKADEEKAVKQKELENRPKRSMPWQVGRKSKRKGHSWTNIKKRNQQKQITGGNENVEGSDDNEDLVSSDSEDEAEGIAENIKCEVIESFRDGISGETEEISGETTEKVEYVTDTLENDGVKDNQIVLSENISDHNLQINKSSFIMPDSEGQVSGQEFKEAMSIPETLGNATFQANMETNEKNNSECNEKSCSETDGPLTLYTCFDINNTSLNCTARYSVNLVSTVKKYRPIAPKPQLSSSKSLCASKRLYSSKPDLIDSKKDSPVESKVSCEDSIESEVNMKPNSRNATRAVSETKEEESFKLAQQGLITGKRKRARVGRVEEFLRNAFKRKRKKLETEEEKTSSPISEHIEHYLDSKDVSPDDSKQSVRYTENLIQGDINYLKPKQAEENTLNLISKVVLSKKKNIEDSLTNEKVKVTPDEISNFKMTNLDMENVRQQKVQAEGQIENELCKSNIDQLKLPSLHSTGKRSRGRPRGPISKNPDQNEPKSVSGITPVKKRGRPRKVQTPEQYLNQFSFVSTSSVSKTDSHTGGEDICTEPDITTESKENKFANNETDQFENQKDTNLLKGGDVEQPSNGASCVTYEEGNKSNGTDDIDNLNECPDSKETIDAFNGEFHGKSYYNSKLDTPTFTTETLADRSNNDYNNMSRCDSMKEDFMKMQHSESNTKVILEVGKNVESKQSITEDIHLNHGPISANNSCGKGESFDEVDGNYFEKCNDVNDGNKYSSKDIVQDTKNNSETVVENEVIQIGSYTMSISDNKSDKTTEDSSVALVIEERITTNKHSVGHTDNVCKNMHKMEGPATAACDNINNNLKCYQQHINDAEIMCIDKVNKFDPCTNEKGKDETADIVTKIVTIAKSEEVTNDITTNQKEPDHCSLESYSNEIKEDSVHLEPILSPGERVKMNKRSCKKDVDLTSPVWVKRTKLNKTHTETGHSVGRKRKISEEGEASQKLRNLK